jgi:hypothetical protein
VELQDKKPTKNGEKMGVHFRSRAQPSQAANDKLCSTVELYVLIADESDASINQGRYGTSFNSE